MRGTTGPVCADANTKPTVVYVDGQAIPCAVGSTLLNALINAGRVVPTACGGAGVCHLCHVQLRAAPGDTAAGGAAAAPPGAVEARALGPEALARGVRLSCRVMVTAPLHVTLLPLPPFPSAKSRR